MAAYASVRGKEESTYSTTGDIETPLQEPPELDMQREKARLYDPVCIRGVEVPAAIRCHVCFDKRAPSDSYSEDNLTVDLCPWGHRAHKACAAEFLDKRGLPYNNCMFCCFHVNHATGLSSQEAEQPGRLQLGIKIESQPSASSSTATDPHRCVDIPSYVVAPAAFDRDTIRRRVMAVIETNPAVGVVILSAVSGRNCVGLPTDQIPRSLDEWGVTLDDIIDHTSFSKFSRVVHNTSPADSTDESVQALDDVFMYLSTALDRDVPGLLLFDRRGGGRDEWYGMDHAAIKAWAKTSDPVEIMPDDPDPDPVDFVRTMLAHRITFSEFVAYSSHVETVVDQFGLGPRHLVAWGLSISTFKSVVKNPAHSDSVLRPAALNALFVQHGYPKGITAWDIPMWDPREFDESFMTSLTDRDWEALDVTIPVLVGMGMPVSNIPAPWFRDAANAPSSACVTTVFTSLFAPKTIREENARAIRTRTRKKSSRPRR